MKALHDAAVKDKKELDEKAAKLKAFVASPDFAELGKAEQDLLKRQDQAMAAYAAVLAEAVATFV